MEESGIMVGNPVLGRKSVVVDRDVPAETSTRIGRSICKPGRQTIFHPLIAILFPICLLAGRVRAIKRARFLSWIGKGWGRGELLVRTASLNGLFRRGERLVKAIALLIILCFAFVLSG
jgi:hypothetical protein